MKENSDIQNTELVLYQPDSDVKLEVRLEDDTVWLNTNQMALLFDREDSNIRRHINNIFKEGELTQNNNVHFLHVNGVKKLHGHSRSTQNNLCHPCNLWEKRAIRMKMENKIKINERILWDIDPKTLDMRTHKSWIIQRVLEYGEIEDWRAIYAYYGLNTIVSACKVMRTLDKRALSFICCLSNTRKEDYRCYHTRQLNQTLWNS